MKVGDLSDFISEGKPIRKREFIQCLSGVDICSKDAEYLYQYLQDESFLHLIIPSLRLEESAEFLVAFLCACIDGIYSFTLSKYDAGSSLLYYLEQFYKYNMMKFIYQTKMALEAIILKGNSETVTCIKCTILEHIFTRDKIKLFFEDWLGSPILKNVYETSVADSHNITTGCEYVRPGIHIDYIVSYINELANVRRMAEFRNGLFVIAEYINALCTQENTSLVEQYKLKDCLESLYRQSTDRRKKLIEIHVFSSLTGISGMLDIIQRESSQCKERHEED